MQYRRLTNRQNQGFTLVELLVTVAVFVLVFGGLFSSVQFAMKLTSATKSSTGALALASERIEYIRSLAYDDIGTVSGIPSGAIPQNSTTSLNSTVYHERVLIQYVDSPEDGTGALDTNSIVADYKEVKVEYSWQNQNGTSTIFLITKIVPPGIESTAGGGTLTVNVFDAGVLPVTGAQVHVYNNTTTSTIDVIRNTNTEGIAMFSGAPAGANYQITVSRGGYSTDQTYSATATNPNPSTPHVAVLPAAVSTMNFQIDELSDLLVRTIGPSTSDIFSDDFSDMSDIAASTNVIESSGDIVLAGGAGAYLSDGRVYATTTNPSVITAWNTIGWTATVPASTSFKVSVYTLSGTSTYTLVPDADLPGNSVGFSSGPINISGLDVVTYPALVVGGEFTSSDVNETPALQDWYIDYIITEPSIATVPFTLTGSKTIGTTLALQPIYKYEGSHSTDAGGEVQLSNLEWDFYNLVLDTGIYDISEACPSLPYALDPGVSDTLKLTLVPSSLYSMRIEVVDPDGDPIVGADVEMSRAGFLDSHTTSACGQVFFDAGLANNNDYQIVVQKAGYTTQTLTGVVVDGTETLNVILAP